VHEVRKQDKDGFVQGKGREGKVQELQVQGHEAHTQGAQGVNMKNKVQDAHAKAWHVIACGNTSLALREDVTLRVNDGKLPAKV
jgi:hypothetical protein